MSIKPILFNTEMVKVVKEGWKTQTRRIIKDNNVCQPFEPGDILWVRETWHRDAGRYMYRANYADDEKFYRDGKEVQLCWSPSIHMPKEAARIFLRVKNVRTERLQDITETQALMEGAYMYRTHAPILPGHDGTAIADFALIWDRIIKPADRDTYGWKANPWVWVIEFERCEKPEGWEAYLHG